MIYEYRVYDVTPGKMNALHELLRDHAMPLFERHGMVVVGFFTTEIGGRNDQLVYLLGFEDLAHRERAWRAFQSDPDWPRAKARFELDGTLVPRISTTIFKPTDYSPLA